MNTPGRTADLHAIEARVAARLAGRLTARAQLLPKDITERLRVAREQAVQRAQAVRRGPAIVGAAGGAAVLGGNAAPWWQRLASVLPLVVLAAGMVLIDHWAVREQVMAAADIDAQLLVDDLPPAAYSDPGFVEFLRSPPPQ